MASVERPNTTALREALDIYRVAMRRFVVDVLEGSGRSARDEIAGAFDAERRDRFRREVRSRGPAGAITIGDFRPIIENHWDLFERHFNWDEAVWARMRLITDENSRVMEPPNEEDIDDQDALALKAYITSILWRVDRDAVAQVDAIWARLGAEAPAPATSGNATPGSPSAQQSEASASPDPQAVGPGLGSISARLRRPSRLFPWLWQGVMGFEVIYALGVFGAANATILSAWLYIRRAFDLFDVAWIQAVMATTVLSALVVVIWFATLRHYRLKDARGDSGASSESGVLQLDMGAIQYSHRHLVTFVAIAAIVVIVWQGLPYLSGGERSSDGSSTLVPATSTAGTSIAATGTVAPARFAVPAVSESTPADALPTFTAPQMWVIADTGQYKSVAWRDDCKDGARVTTRDEFGEAGASTRAGTVWGEGTAVLEVRDKHVGVCAETGWRYVVSADPVPGEEDGGSWVRLGVPASAPDGVEKGYLAETDVMNPQEYVDAVEAAGCAVTGVSLAPKDALAPKEERLDRYDDDGTALLEVSCSPAADGWQLETLGDAIREYPDCELVGISLSGENYPFPGTTIDALPDSVGAEETLVLRCDTGERRFVPPPEPPDPSADGGTQAGGTPSSGSAANRIAPPTATPTPTPAPPPEIAQATGHARYFVDTGRGFLENESGQGITPQGLVGEDCDLGTYPSSPDLDLKEGMELIFHGHRDKVGCFNWWLLSPLPSEAAPGEEGRFWLLAVEVAVCEVEEGTLDYLTERNKCMVLSCTTDTPSRSDCSKLNRHCLHNTTGAPIDGCEAPESGLPRP